MSSWLTDHPAGADAGAEQPDGLVQVEMPKMGISVSEGTIVEWRKQPGDWIEADETIVDVTTDKIDVEIPAPATGRLARIIAEPGVTVPVGEPIAEIDSAARPGEAHPDEHTGEHAVVANAPAARAAEPAAPSGQADRAPEQTTETDRSSFISPVVRRIAEKHGIDLSRIRGTGIGGRIRKKDVVEFVRGGGVAPAAEPAHAGNGAGRPAPVLHTESPYRPDEPAPKAAPEPAAAPAAPPPAGVPEPEPVTAEGDLLAGRREPMSPMRQLIARHMVESRRTAAHCTTIVEVDMSRVAARRTELKDAMARRGVRLTYLAFVAKAAVEALGHHPILNASIEGTEIVYHDDVNLGIAVALDDGLIVPVIPKAQRLSTEGLAVAIADVADRARAKRLEPDDVHGGTFTITNPGQFGAVLATPIINQPQVAILDLEAIVKRAVVIEGPQGDSIAIRPITYVPMSWDHRALDGAEAARFLSRVKARLELWDGE